ncbi:uncharacterized protein LOC143210184 isoform X1 [Lasioglossum baleicum]|uniref:uncharacterized protein LOC143210184 isoform X1 n=1 Tax=Lasioglossum baleicum TaxID=434251 RepID=UPI003FCD32E5
MCKLLERMINTRLQWWFEYNNMIPSTQSGFRRGRSCTDNLANLNAYVRVGFINKEFTVSAFLDVKSAFDNVQYNLLLQKLSRLSIPNRMLSFIANWMYCRYAQFDNQQEIRYIHIGLPQGGVISPLLYNIYVSQLLDGIPEEIQISQYADDIALYYRNISLDKAKQYIEQAIDRIIENLHDIGLELSPNKSEVIIFNNRNLRPNSIPVRIGQHTKLNSGQVKFLGMIFDSKLTFELHISKLRQQCFKALNIIKYLRGVWWGSDPETLLTIYRTYIRSRLDYGSFVYFPEPDWLRRRLETIQATAIKLALGLRTSTPTNVVLAEAGTPYLQHRAAYLGKIFFSKIISNTSHITNRYIRDLRHSINSPNTTAIKYRTSIFNNCIREVLEFEDLYYKGNNYVNFITNFHTSLIHIQGNITLGKQLTKSPFINEELNDFIDRNYSNSISIYTDGSKTKNGISTGAAVYCPQKKINQTFSINNIASVFTAECIAITKAIDICLEDDTNQYLILSDSLSAIQSLTSINVGVATNRYIIDAKEKIREFNSNNRGKIDFIWIPSHCGIKGNEEVDTSAKLGTTSDYTENMKVPFTDFKELHKRNMWREFGNKLLVEFNNKGQLYYEKYYEPKRKPWFYNQRLTREIVVRFNRLRSNHYNSNESLARLGIIDSPKCECDAPYQDINHILWHCPKYRDERQVLFRNLINAKWKPPYDVHIFLKEPKIKILRIINDFCNKCNIRL